MAVAGLLRTRAVGGLDQFLIGTRKIWWLFLCVDCLPVFGHVTLFWLRSARFFGRLFPSYRSPILCLSVGPLSIVTEIPSSCIPPHLLQETTILYLDITLRATEGGVSCIASFSCMRSSFPRRILSLALVVSSSK